MRVDDANRESKALISALQDYQNEDVLTKEQKSAARLRSTQDLLDGIDPGLLSLKNKDCTRIRRSMEYMRPFMDALTHLAPGMDVFANADPHGILSLVWGSVRMVLIVAHDYQNFLDDIVNLFMDVRPDLERLKLYLSTFQQNKRLQTCLSSVYCEIMHMCSWLRRFFQSSRTRRLVKHVLTPTSLKSEAQSFIVRIKNACKNAEGDASLAHAQANVEAHKILQIQNEQIEKKLTKLELDGDARTAREEAQQASGTLRGIGKWLDPVAMEDELERRKRDIMAGTCSWIEQYRSVFDWLWDRDGKHLGAVWITAQPGYGKSHLATYLVDTRLSHYPCAFFFCSVTNPAYTTALSVLRTVAWQILQHSKDLAHLVKAEWETGAKLSLNTIRKVLDSLLVGPSFANILIDGFDECSIAERKLLLPHIRHLSTRANIVILSRPELDITTAIKVQFSNTLLQHIELSPSENLVDIKKFTWSQVRALDLSIDIDMQRNIIDNIWSRADGMFLWVRLVVDELDAQKYFQHGELDSLLEVVASFPTGVEAAYSRAAGAISDQRSVLRDAIRLLLTWIIFAKRPLTVAELQVATTYQLGQRPGKSQSIRVSSLLQDFCRSFVSVDTVTNRARPIHETAAYFLMNSDQAGELSMVALEAHESIATTCVGFATDTLASLPAEAHTNNASDAYDGSRTKQLYDALKVDSTFLEYGAIAWPLHASSVSSHLDATPHERLGNLHWPNIMNPMSTKAIARLLKDETLVLRWIRLISCYRMERRPLVENMLDVLHSWTENTTLTDSKQGDDLFLSDYLAPLLSHIGRAPGKRVHRLRKYMDWHQRFPVQYFELNHLYAAAFFDYGDEIKRLVDTGANINLQVGTSTALIYAACGESPDAIERLLDLGVNVNVISPHEDDSALSRSYECVASDEAGDYAAADTLLRLGAKLHPPRAPSNAFAFLCASNNLVTHRLKALDRLFEIATDQDLEYSGRTFGWLPLHEVVHRDEPEMVQALLKHHTHPDRYAAIPTDDTGKTPLHIACEKHHSKAIHVLLQYAKGSIDSQNPHTGSTALHVAAVYRSDALFALLEFGATVNKPDGQGRTALHAAALADWLEGVKALLQAEADPHAKDRRGLTAAFSAREGGSERTAKMLENWAESSESLTDEPGESPTVHSLTASDIEATGRVVRFLLLQHSHPTGAVIARPTRNKVESALSPWLSPTALTAQILDYTEYQLNIAATTNRETTVNRDQAQWQAYVYLSAPPLPPSPLLLVTQIHVESVSHDQGWSDETHLWGTYVGGWTGFSFGTRRAKGSGEVERGPKVSQNMHANTKPRLHTLDCNREGTVVANTESPHDAKDEFKQWIVSLRPGDEVCLLADAAWPGWVNFVYHAKLRLTVGFAR